MIKGKWIVDKNNSNGAKDFNLKKEQGQIFMKIKSHSSDLNGIQLIKVYISNSFMFGSLSYFY